MLIVTQSENQTRIQIQPNRSAKWQQILPVLIFLGFLSPAIGIFWTLMGAWVILPFAGLEVVLLFYFVHRACYKSYHQQVLYLEEDFIRLEWGYNFPKKKWKFNRDEIEFVINNPHHSLSPHVLELRFREQNLRIGEALNMDDMDRLCQLIKTIGVRYRMRGITQTIALDTFDKLDN